MEYSLLAFKQVIIVFVIIVVGIICYKNDIISKEAGKYLSNFVLTIVTPIFIFMSYQIELSKEILIEILFAFIMSVITHIFFIIISRLFVSEKSKENIIDRFSLIYTNCGFMGIPLIEGVFGSQGVIFVTVFLAVFNVFVWSHGLFMMKENTSSKDMLSVIMSPAIVGVVLGFICFVLNIRLPDILAKPLNYIGSMNTPLAMTVAGITIGQTDIQRIIKNTNAIKISLIRLLVLPAIIIPLMSRIQCSDLVFMTVMLAACCPTAAIGTLFAVKYDKNAIYASEIFSISTILSAISMPLMILYMGLFR